MSAWTSSGAFAPLLYRIASGYLKTCRLQSHYAAEKSAPHHGRVHRVTLPVIHRLIHWILIDRKGAAIRTHPATFDLFHMERMPTSNPG